MRQALRRPRLARPSPLLTSPRCFPRRSGARADAPDLGADGQLDAAARTIVDLTGGTRRPASIQSGNDMVRPPAGQWGSLHGDDARVLDAARVRPAPRGATAGGSDRAVTFLGAGGFVVYAIWAAFQGEHYAYGPYLFAFYSPSLRLVAAALFGPKPSWWPAWLVFSPALLILWRPALRLVAITSRRVLQGILGRLRPRALGERGRSIAAKVRCRSCDEHPSLFPLSHAPHPFLPGPRRLVRDVVPRPRRPSRSSASAWERWCWPQRRPAGRICNRLPFAAPLGRRISRSAVVAPGGRAVLSLRELPHRGHMPWAWTQPGRRGLSPTSTYACARWA